MRYIDKSGHCWETLDVLDDGTLKVRLEFASEPSRTAVFCMSPQEFEQLASRGNFRLLGRVGSQRASREAEGTLA